jgi:hypothetical protein
MGLSVLFAAGVFSALPAMAEPTAAEPEQQEGGAETPELLVARLATAIGTQDATSALACYGRANEEQQLAAEYLAAAMQVGSAKVALREALVAKFGEADAARVTSALALRKSAQPFQKMGQILRTSLIAIRGDMATAGKLEQPLLHMFRAADGRWYVDGSPTFRAQQATPKEMRALAWTNNGLAVAIRACLPVVQPSKNIDDFNQKALAVFEEQMKPVRSRLAEEH